MAIHRTKEQEQALRDELLRVSIRTFMRDGYAETSMKQLAAEAKCSTGRFYGNFTGKQELLYLMMERFMDATEAEAQSLCATEDNAMMHYLYVWAICMRAGGANARLGEIYEHAFADAQVMRSLSERYENILAECLRGRYGLEYASENMRARSLAALGILQSLMKAGVSSDSQDGKQELCLMAELILGVYGLSREDVEMYVEKLGEKCAVVKEAAYQTLIRILQKEV